MNLYLHYVLRLALFGVIDATFYALIYRFNRSQLEASALRAAIVSLLISPSPQTFNMVLVVVSVSIICLVNTMLILFHWKSIRVSVPRLSFYSLSFLLLLPCLEEVFYRRAMVGSLGGYPAVLISALWFTLNHSPFRLSRLVRGSAYGLLFFGGGSNATAYCCACHVLSNTLAAAFAQQPAKTLLCRSCSRSISSGAYFECADCTFNVSFFCVACVESRSTHHKPSHRLVPETLYTPPTALPSTEGTLGAMFEQAFALYSDRMLFEKHTYAQVWRLVTRRVAELEETTIVCQRVPIDATGERLSFWVDFVAAIVANRVAVPGDHQSDLSSLVEPDASVAMIVFSSGTTGKQKGALWTHSICLHVVSESLGRLDSGRLVVVDFQPLCHAFTLRQFTRAVFRGGRLFLASILGVQDLSSVFARARPTLVGATPAFYRAIRAMRVSGSQFFGNRVQFFLAGGAAVPYDLLQWMRSLRADASVIDGYSTTESSAVQHPQNSVVLLDDGEIAVSGPSVISRYEGDQGAERFAEINGQRYFRTGDFGRYAEDGSLKVVGRKAFAFKLSQGEFVQPEQIEVLVEALPGVSEALVWGHSLWSFVLCVVVLEESDRTQQVSLEDVQRACHHRASWEIPQALLYASGFARTSSGKKYRMEILRHWTPALQRAHDSLTVVGTGAFNEAVRRAAPSLNCADRSKSFVECGGDSISALALANLLGITALDVLRSRSLLDLERFAAGGSERPLESPGIDWASECQPIDIVADIQEGWESQRGPERCLLLLGGTGFMGPFLLKELSRLYDRVYCIVRGSADRIQASKVIRPLVGDVSLDLCGLDRPTYDMLASKCCAVFNNAAWVNGLMQYQDLKATNVGGAIETLKFAVHKSPKHVSFVSSVNVLRGQVSETPLEFGRCLSLLDHMPGYAQTKMVAELILARTVPRLPAVLGLTIFRPATVSGCSTTAASNVKCFTNGVIGALASLESLPSDLLDTLPRQLLLTPVDWVCHKMAQLHTTPGVFHLVTPRPIKWRSVVDALLQAGFSLPQHSDTLDIPQDNPLYVFKPALQAGGGFPLSNNEPTDSSVNASCPVVDRALMVKYIRWLAANSTLFPSVADSTAADPRFRIEAWYPRVAQFTPETLFIQLSDSEVQSILNWSKPTTSSRPSVKGKTFTFRVEDAGLTTRGDREQSWILEDDTHQSLGALPRSLRSLAAQVDQRIERLGGCAFIRLSDRSPKDSALPLCCRDGASALRLLASSARVRHDLRSAAYGTFRVAVRRFEERIAGAREIRLFATAGELRAASQYHRDREFRWEDDIERRVQRIWRLLRPLVPGDCALDVALLSRAQEFILIEVNHGPPIADLVFVSEEDLRSPTFVFRHK